MLRFTAEAVYVDYRSRALSFCHFYEVLLHPTVVFLYCTLALSAAFIETVAWY